MQTLRILTLIVIVANALHWFIRMPADEAAVATVVTTVFYGGIYLTIRLISRLISRLTRRRADTSARR
jgi:hypothetical protein